ADMCRRSSGSKSSNRWWRIFWPRETKMLERDCALARADGVFEKVRMLQPGELDREAVFEMPHDTARRLAERDQRADRRALVDRNASARLRHVNDPAADIDAVRQDQAGNGVTREDTAVVAIFRQAEDMAVGEPGQWAASLSRLRGVAAIVIAK